VAIRLESGRHHPPAAVGHDRALERRLGLQPDDDFVFLVDVAWRVSRNRTGNLRHVEHALLALLDEELLKLLPDLQRAFRGRREEGLVPVVRFVILLDEIADVDLFLPETCTKAMPRRRVGSGGFIGGCDDVHFSLLYCVRRYARVSTRPSTLPVCRAITSSSFVGITHADTAPPVREIRVCFLLFASVSSSMPSHADPSQMRLRTSAEFSPIPAVNTSPSIPPSTAASPPISR